MRSYTKDHHYKLLVEVVQTMEDIILAADEIKGHKYSWKDLEQYR